MFKLTNTGVARDTVPRRVKLPRSYYIILVILVLLLFFSGWAQDNFDLLFGVGNFITYLLFAVVFSVLNWLALKSPLGKLYGRLWSIPVVAGTIVVSMLVAVAWNQWGFPASVHSILRSDGKVVMADVTSYDLSTSDNAIFNSSKTDDITKAGLINVRLKLPDGRTTSLAIDRNKLTYNSGLSRDGNEVLTVELLQSKMRVRYWTHGIWMARPEIEFSPLTKEEGCQLLHNSSPVCH